MREAAVDVSRKKMPVARWDLAATSVKYSVRIKDPPTTRKCEVYVSSDWDLEVLLFFLRSVPGLEYEVGDLRLEKFDF